MTIVENGSPADGWRDFVFVRQDTIEIRGRAAGLLNGSHELIEAAESFDLFGVTKFCGLQPVSQDRQGFVVCVQRYGEWMAVLSA
jgi:hypothetical protein